MGRRIAACVVALAVASASVADSQATCHEEADARPSLPSCAGMPCQTPGIETVPVLLTTPLLNPCATLAVSLEEPASADAPPPPTPPPTAALS